MADIRPGENQSQWVLGAALIAIGIMLVLALMFVRQRATSVTTSVTIEESAPTVEEVKICDPAVDATNACTNPVSFATNPGADKTMDLWARVKDLNGINDIDTGSGHVDMAFYHAGAGGGVTATYCGGVATDIVAQPAHPDGNNCYAMTNCTESSLVGDGVQAWYKCTIALKYWADATNGSTESWGATDNWHVYAIATDKTTPTGLTGTLEANTEINEVVSLADFQTTIDFGSKSLGYTTDATNNLTNPTPIYQHGNTDADFQISADATNMGCSVLGNIPLANIQWSRTDDAWGAGSSTAIKYYNAGTYVAENNPAGNYLPQWMTLYGGSANSAQMGIQRRTNDDETSFLAANDAHVFFNLKVPTTGVKGVCTLAATVTAVAQPVSGNGG